MIKIAIADDQELIRESLKIILSTNEDFNICFLASNGNDVLDKMKTQIPDVILMDIRMPEMDGLQATQTIRAMNREDSKTIPIIALTANAFDEDVQRSLQAGLNAHLTKPVEAQVD